MKVAFEIFIGLYIGSAIDMLVGYGMWLLGWGIYDNFVLFGLVLFVLAQIVGLITMITSIWMDF